MALADWLIRSPCDLFSVGFGMALSCSGWVDSAFSFLVAMFLPFSNNTRIFLFYPTVPPNALADIFRLDWERNFSSARQFFGSSTMTNKASAQEFKGAGAQDRNLAMELVRVTEAAAIAASEWVGFGEKNIADGAAVDAMRGFLRTGHMDGTRSIGEGEKDEAPMLVNGERSEERRVGTRW